MTDEMRVLVLDCEFPPIGGGAATATAYLLRQFEKLPIRATLVTASADDRARSEDFTARCRVHYVPVGKKDLHYWTTRELATYTWKAHRHVRSLERAGEEFDLCHAFFTLPVGAAAWLERKSRPYVISLCGSDVPGFSKRFTWVYVPFGFVFRMIWRGAAAVVSNSEELKALAERSAPDVRFDVIPNGIDTQTFHPGAPREKAATILTVARLVPRKDVATAIRATALVAKEFPDARLAVVGDGPLAGELERLAAAEGIGEKVLFRRSVPRERMADLYREADVFVLTSMREGMSNTVLEALASGLPTVLSREALAGINAPGALTAKPGDAAATAAAIRRYLADGELRRRAGEESRRAAERYAWPSVAREFYETYRRVLEAGKTEGRR